MDDLIKEAIEDFKRLGRESAEDEDKYNKYKGAMVGPLALNSFMIGYCERKQELESGKE